MPIVTTKGFAPDDEIEFVSPDAADGGKASALDLPSDYDPSALAESVDGVDIIRIAFPKYGDGRGFSLAQKLRDLGYEGRLRAHGYLISDQFRHALQCGFDEVQIDEELAARQPEKHWQVGGWPQYRNKLSRAS